jgi:hypothetical protein
VTKFSNHTLSLHRPTYNISSTANFPWPSPTDNWLLQTQNQSYVTTDGEVGQSVLVSSTHLGLTTRFYYCQTVAGLLMWDALSDERTSLPFTIAAGPREHRHSWVRVLRDSWPYFTVSDSRLPQPRGPDPSIYIPQEQDDPVTPPGTGFPLRRLLRLAGLRWRYSNPPPPDCSFKLSPYKVAVRTTQHRKHRPSIVVELCYHAVENSLDADHIGNAFHSFRVFL